MYTFINGYWSIDLLIFVVFIDWLIDLFIIIFIIGAAGDRSAGTLLSVRISAMNMLIK